MNLTEHLKSRHLDMSLHTVWIDQVEGVATFPFWNLSGCMRGYQQYRPSGDKKKFNNPKEGRYYTYRSKFNPDKNRASEVAVWGMESWYLTNVLFITEGIFDAARLTELGVSAIAMAANDLDKTTARWLSTVRRFRPVVAVCDGDKAGRRLAKQGHVSIIMPDGTDLGGASDSFVTDLLKEYGKSKSKTFKVTPTIRKRLLITFEKRPSLPFVSSASKTTTPC